jgi:hypothetical protein
LPLPTRLNKIFEGNRKGETEKRDRGSLGGSNVSTGLMLHELDCRVFFMTIYLTCHGVSMLISNLKDRRWYTLEILLYSNAARLTAVEDDDLLGTLTYLLYPFTALTKKPSYYGLYN